MLQNFAQAFSAKNEKYCVGTFLLLFFFAHSMLYQFLHLRVHINFWLNERTFILTRSDALMQTFDTGISFLSSKALQQAENWDSLRTESAVPAGVEKSIRVGAKKGIGRKEKVKKCFLVGYTISDDLFLFRSFSPESLEENNKSKHGAETVPFT